MARRTGKRWPRSCFPPRPGPDRGLHAFADTLRGAGHTVHTPDLFEGRTFGTIEEGVAYAERSAGTRSARGERAADLPAELVYAGFSLGVVPAQKLAQTRPGAQGALFFYSCVPRRSSARGRPASRCRSTGWTRTRSSWARATSTPPASSWRQPRTPSSSCTRATSTTSRTPACRLRRRRGEAPDAARARLPGAIG